MERWQCELCGGVFDEPVTHRETCTDADGRRQIVSRRLCPICGMEGRVTRVETCPRCGGWKRAEEGLCGICREELKKRFCDFCDELTEEEEDLLDDWLDGRSVRWRARFNE